MSTINEQQKAVALAKKVFLARAEKFNQTGDILAGNEESVTADFLDDAWKTLQDIKTLQEINARIARIANVIEER